MKKRISIITGSRADYGLLKQLIKGISGDSSLSLRLLVTGMHLSREFGFTYKEIEKDGFKINKKINIVLKSDTSEDISKSMAYAIEGFAKEFKRVKPDIIVVLGDRFEIFSAVIAAHIAKIPIAHIHGGELTEGAFDDAFRHSITKMSHLHFTSTQEYRKRVIQLGEDPKRVFNVGAIGLDNLEKMNLLPKKTLERLLNFRFNQRNLLVTFHPVTLENDTSYEQFNNLLNALKELKDTSIIFTKANADTNGRIINSLIDGYVRQNTDKTIVFRSLGRLRYLSALRYVDAVVGNSSSGIIEAPSFKIGTVNIGDRQKGRIKARSIIDCKPTKESIQRAIKRIYSSKFQEGLFSIKNPYRGRDTVKKILKILKEYNLKTILKKNFYDLDFKYGRDLC